MNTEQALQAWRGLGRDGQKDRYSAAIELQEVDNVEFKETARRYLQEQQEYQQSLFFFVTRTEWKSALFCQCHSMSNLPLRYQAFDENTVHWFERPFSLINNKRLLLADYADYLDHVLASPADKRAELLFGTVQQFQVKSSERGINFLFTQIGARDRHIKALFTPAGNSIIKRDTAGMQRQIREKGFAILSPMPYQQVCTISLSLELLLTERQYYPDAHTMRTIGRASRLTARYCPPVKERPEIKRGVEPLLFEGEVESQSVSGELLSPLFEPFETGDYLCINQSDGHAIVPAMILLGEQLSPSVYRAYLYTTGDSKFIRKNAILSRQLYWFESIAEDATQPDGRKNPHTGIARVSATVPVTRVIEVDNVAVGQ